MTECRADALDVVFIMDGSGSIGDTTFDELKRFVGLVVDQLDVGGRATRVAVVQYSTDARVEFGFDAWPANQPLGAAIAALDYLSGATHTGNALDVALDLFTAGARGGHVASVGVVLTDGQSQDAVGAAAGALHAAGVLVYAVGVTDLINLNELYEISGEPNRVFAVRTFDQLNAPLAAVLTQRVCELDYRAGVPEIICESDRIGVRATTRNPFEGHVFVKNHFHRDGCRRGADAFANPYEISLSVAFTDCDIRRWRSLNPRGVFVETTIIFMFHTLFMTKVDQAVTVQCFYMEADKTVSVPLEVSMLTTMFAEELYPMPTCSHSLRQGGADGPVVEFAAVGQKLFHVWQCVESDARFDIFGMLVHSCFVDDGGGDRVDLLDERGCPVDVRLLGAPQYEADLRVAVREYHVFKYADRPVLQFQCQISVCIKRDGGCDSLTPPQCAAGSGRVRRDGGGERARFVDSLDVLSDALSVADVQPAGALNCSPLETASSQASSSQWCVRPLPLAFVVGALTSALSVGMLAVVIFYCRRRRRP